jgi:hypothetical protein
LKKFNLLFRAVTDSYVSLNTRNEIIFVVQKRNENDTSAIGQLKQKSLHVRGFGELEESGVDFKAFQSENVFGIRKKATCFICSPGQNNKSIKNSFHAKISKTYFLDTLIEIYVFPCGQEVTLFRTHFSGHGPWRRLLVCLVS